MSEKRRSPDSRPYRMRRRGEQVDQTLQRIIRTDPQIPPIDSARPTAAPVSRLDDWYDSSAGHLAHLEDR